MFRVLHLDVNHPSLILGLQALGFANDEDYESDRANILQKIDQYDGVILRSRIPIDATFFEKATQLKFIGRVGAGVENIDLRLAKDKGVSVFSAPEGNRNAVGEHTLGLLLALMNRITKAHKEVRKGIWDREGNRGFELSGKTVGIYGYGNMGKAFAKKLKSMEVEVICYDIVGGVGDENARQVGILEFRQKADVVSLHLPQTPQTVGLVNLEFIEQMQKPFWLLNTGRGSSVVTDDLVLGLKSKQVLGAGLDVLEYEKSSFEGWLNKKPKAFKFLRKAPNVIFTPHVAGWTKESHKRLAEVIVDKIKREFC